MVKIYSSAGFAGYKLQIISIIRDYKITMIQVFIDTIDVKIAHYFSKIDLKDVYVYL